MQGSFYRLDELAYARSRHPFRRGEPLLFDEPYRLAHLPLVAPAHSAVIAEKPGTDYAMGRYATPRHSLVIPVADAALDASPTYRRFMAELAAMPWQAKIAWDMQARRAGKLHVTIAGGLDADRLPAIVEAVQTVMARPPIRYRLMGPLVGQRNLGRIYLPAVPEKAADGDRLAALQAALGRPETGFYGLGLIQLADELDADEAAMLADLVARWQDAVMVEAALDHVAILATHDDLALSGRWIRAIGAKAGATGPS